MQEKIDIAIECLEIRTKFDMSKKTFSDFLDILAQINRNIETANSHYSKQKWEEIKKDFLTKG